MKLIDFIPIVGQILDLIAKNKKKKRERQLLKTIGKLLDLVQEATDWRDAVEKLWEMVESGELPMTIRRPEHVKQWLFTTIALIEKLTEKAKQDER